MRISANAVHHYINVYHLIVICNHGFDRLNSFDILAYADSEVQEKKEEIWLSHMTKVPTPTEMSKGQSDNTYNASKKFDYTAVADRLRTVSWSNYGHPTGVVNLDYGPNLPISRNSRLIKKTHV